MTQPVGLLCFLLIAYSCVGARVSSRVDEPSSYTSTAPFDTPVQEVWSEDDCPVQGSFEDLKKAGHRLLYEHRFRESFACNKRAMAVYLRPSLAKPSTPMEMPRFRRLYSKSADLPDSHFESLHSVLRLLRKEREETVDRPWEQLMRDNGRGPYDRIRYRPHPEDGDKPEDQ